jgi:hypothetical protein
MGSDVTPGGIRFQMDDRIKPLGKRQLSMRDAGQDPKDANLCPTKGGKGSQGQIL